MQVDKSATLATNNDQYLFQPVGALASSAVNAETTDGSISPCLMARAGTGGNQLPLIALANPIWMATQQGGAEIRTDDKAPTVTAAAGMSGNNQPVVCYPATAHPCVFRQGGFGDYVEGEVGTLRAAGGDYGGGTENLLVEKPTVRYIVRRLTPTECARLQGFADRWGDIDKKDSFTPEEYSFWHEVRNTHAAINGKKVQKYTEQQMLMWYNKLHTDSAEYKMWGNGIALPPALYCMQGISEVLNDSCN